MEHETCFYERWFSTLSMTEFLCQPDCDYHQASLAVQTLTELWMLELFHCISILAEKLLSLGLADVSPPQTNRQITTTEVQTWISRPPGQREALPTDKYLALKVKIERSLSSISTFSWQVSLIRLDLPVTTSVLKGRGRFWQFRDFVQRWSGRWFIRCLLINFSALNYGHESC